MKRQVLTAIGLLIFYNNWAQIIDTAKLIVKYKFQFAADSPHINSKNDDFLELDIGGRISRCYSLYKRNKTDKILADLLQNRPEDHRISIDYSKYSSMPNGMAQEVFKNNMTGEIFVLDDIMTYKCYYTDSLNLFNWMIMPDTVSLLNYHCQKAITTFRGRNYVAWFTTEIPFSNGPLKFGTLPGLILKISDDKNYLDFSCIEIQKPVQLIKIGLNVSGYARHKRADIKILKERSAEDPVAFINSISPNNKINSVDANSYKPGLNKKKPFSIELE